MRLALPWFGSRRAPARVVLHIGMSKCGSSSIQEHFVRHEDAYRRQGVVYPKRYREKGFYRHLPLYESPRELVPGRVAEIAAEARGARAVLLSCENWSERLDKGNAPVVAAELARQFGAENVTVLAYFRAPLGFLSSAYAQFLIRKLFDVPKRAFFESPLPPGIGRFLETAAGVRGYERHDYLAEARRMAACFPGVRLELRSFEREDLTGGDLIGDVCGLLGCTPETEAPVANARRSPTSLLAIQHVQTVLPWEHRRPKRQLFRSFRLSTADDWSEADCRHRDLHVGPELAARIAARFEADRDEIAARFASPVSGLLRVPPVPPLSDRALSAAEKAEVEEAFRPRT